MKATRILTKNYFSLKLKTVRPVWSYISLWLFIQACIEFCYKSLLQVCLRDAPNLPATEKLCVPYHVFQPGEPVEVICEGQHVVIPAHNSWSQIFSMSGPLHKWTYGQNGCTK